MKAKAIHNGIGLMNATATLLRSAALTIGPTLLKAVGDEQGKAFAGLVTEREAATGTVLPFGSGPQRAGNVATPITYVCMHCGSDDVGVELMCYWHDERQQWALSPNAEKPELADCTYCGHTQLRQKLLRQQP
jgi:hypothetical protein